MSTSAWMAVVVAALVSLPGCGDESSGLPKPGPGVVFSYPFAGQMDVPLGARMVVTFSDGIDTEVLNQPCTGTLPTVQGGFCVAGPGGVVSGSVMALGATEDNGNRNTIVHFQSDGFEPGVTYSVFVAPTLMASAALPTNIPESGPLFSFQTAYHQVASGDPPVVWAINSRPPGDTRFPFMDFTAIRVLVSELLDQESVVLGETFEFVEVSGNDEFPVAGTLLVGGPHITFDPESDLTPGRSYRLRLSSGILDAGGEPLADQEFEFTPFDSRTDEGVAVVQVLNTEPAAGDDGFPAVSSIMGDTINSIRVASQLVGESAIDVRDANLETVMGNPARFEDNIPLTIRKGQLMVSTGLDVRLGGAVPANLATGDVTIGFISDATGYVVRNPFRTPETLPDEVESPLFVYLTFDAAVSAEDATGNAVLNQNLLGVQVAGLAQVRDGALFIEAAGTIELDLLGVTKASANLVFSMATTSPETVSPLDTTAPRLVASHPFDGQDDFSPTTSIRLIFDEPVETRPDAGEIELVDSNGAPVDILAHSVGSTLVLTPRAGPLSYNTSYTVRITTARDMNGNLAALDGGDATGGDGAIDFSTPALSGSNAAPPLLTSLYPGVPCTLVDAEPGVSPGRCAGGESDDDKYAPFTMPANRYVLATFDKPMNPGTINLGQTCGTGSFRVEELDPSGACVGPVPGSLDKRERSARFHPERPWRAGTSYRLTLATGTNDSCAGDGSEICGQNGQPLNPDPLNGTEDGEGGGPTPTLIIDFTGAPATEDTFVPAFTGPFTDINGSGFVEGVEVPRDENRAALQVIGTPGIIPDSSDFSGDDCIPSTPEQDGCMYVAAAMPVSMQAAQNNCVIGQDESGNDIVVSQCVPARIFPQIIYGTSLTIDLGFLGSSQTGRSILRMREDLSGPSLGYIIEDPDTGEPTLWATLDTYMDAPDMTLPVWGIGQDHDLKSKPLTITISGPVAFAPDGRMQIQASNVEDIEVTVNVEFIGFDAGSIILAIPAGAMRLQLVSEPAMGTQR